MRPDIRFVATTDGVRIAYCCDGNGPPLVFVRGWISHLENMWEIDAIRAFFEAIHNDKLDELREILYPGRFEALQKEDGLLDYFVDNWKKCTVKEIGGVTADSSPHVGRDQGVSVAMTYDCGGSELEDSVTISRLGDKWYWDEN